MNIDDFINCKQPRVLFCTGAGLSKESGIPTFRDAAEEGIWENYDLDDVCNISTFRKNYNMVHAFYNERRMALEHVFPNTGHLLIAELQKRYGLERVMHITANVDDLAERAGGTAMHIHGNLTQIVEPWQMEDYKVLDIGYTEYKPKEGILAKPAVVFFGEAFRYENGVRKELYSDMYKVVDSLTENDIVIVIGSSDTVVNWSNIVGQWAIKSYSVNVNVMYHNNDHMFSANIYKPITDAIIELDEIISKKMESDECPQHM